MKAVRFVPFVLFLVAGPACSKGGPPAATPGTSGGAGSGGDPGNTEVETVVEKLPDGSTRTTTITRTHSTVPAPPPPPRPADPYPGDPLVRYNVDLVNRYRAQGGLAPLLYDAKISAFAMAGSQQLSGDHTPHAHFAANIQSQPPGFGSRSAENQGDPRGVPPMAADATTSGQKVIAALLQIMMNEGPGGGHYDNIMSPDLRRVGVGISYAGGRLYLTNDFSD
jgi:hypothetical protein